LIFGIAIKPFNKYIILGWLLCANFINGLAQNWSQASFEHLGTADGLSSSNIYCIYRDSKGFLWVGTDNGLNRFDGYKFQSFRNQLSEKASISNNHISDIFEDEDGILWIATWKFINSYNLSTGKFKMYTYKTDENSELDCRINKINYWNKDTLLVSTNSGPALFCKSTGNYIFFKLNNNSKNVGSNYVFGLKKMKNNNVLVATFDDLYLINPYTKISNKVALSNLKIHKHYSHVTGKITPFHKNEWLIETWNSDLLIYNDSSNNLRNHFFDKPYTDVDYGGGVLSTLKNKDGYILGTNGRGIIVTDLSLKIKDQVRYDEKISNSISSDYVTCVYKDKEGIYWIGTDKGLNKFDPRKQKFKLHKHIFRSPYFNTDDKIFSLLVTKNKQIFSQGLWGAYCFDTSSISPTFLEALNTNNFHNFFGTPFYIKDSLLCVARKGGFQTFYYKFSKDKFSFYNINDYITNNKYGNPTDIYYIDTAYYVLFNKEGLFKVNCENKAVESINLELTPNKYLEAERYNVLLPNSNKAGYFYLGTSPHGLFEVNLQTKKAKKFDINIVSDNDILNITKICQNAKGDLWLATEFHGVLYYNSKQQKWFELPQHNIIANNFIRNIDLIGDTILSICLNEAMFLLNLKDQKLTKLGIEDGLDEESVPSSFLLHQQQVYFAHDKGYLEADFKNLLKNSPSAGVVFTEVFTGNQTTLLNSNHHNVSLAYPENSLRISFAMLSFFKPSQHKFQYKIIGSNSKWIDIGTNHELVLHKLPYGEYKLLVKEIGNDKLKLAEMAVLTIAVEAPFYLQNWFLILCIIFTAGLVMLIYRMLLLRKIAILKTRDTIARDLHDEVGSALTSISYLSEMGKIQKENGAPTFDKIGETSRSITSLMNDIIWAINPDKDNAISIIQRINYFIQEHQHREGLSISFDYSNKLLHHSFSMSQRKSLYLIFKEALNNAFKYANASQINIRLLKSGNEIILEIEDNGIGINNLNHKGNGMQNMKKRANDIGALFEIITFPEKGTLIRVLLNHHNWGS
jgi:signal transduction histidine kinase